MKIQNVSGASLTLPWLGDRLVLAGQVIEIPDEVAKNYDFPAPVWKTVRSAPDHTFTTPDPLDLSAQAPTPTMMED